MAGTLKTAFFNLAKYAANDISSWLSDFNGNMDKIDTAMNANKTAAQSAQDGVNNLKSEYKTVVQTLATHTNQIDANEKAIAANSASIKKIGDQVNEIVIGEYKFYNSENPGIASTIDTLISSFSIVCRRIGNGAEMSGTLVFNAGTLHTYDRQLTSGPLSGYYVTDLIRLSGNPLNLVNESIGYGLVMGGGNGVESNGTTLTGTYSMMLCIAYYPDSGYTVIGLAKKTTSQYQISNGETAEINF